MNHQELERSFISLQKHFVDIKVYIKEHFTKDGLLQNIKQLERLDKLDIPIDSEELNIEKAYHKLSDSFHKLNPYIYETYRDDIKLRAFLTHILMILQDLGEHYYYKAIKERDDNKTDKKDNPKKPNKDRVLQ